MIRVHEEVESVTVEATHKFNSLCVVGLGYIGLPTAAIFASCGLRVIGVDVSPAVVETINQGKIHIVEPDLGEVVRNAVVGGLLKAVLKPEPADAFIIAVPTPFKGDNREPDLSYIEAAARAIAPVLEKGNLVILESTSPVGATEKMAEWLAECRGDLTFPRLKGDCCDIHIAHCPERVLPGKIMTELVENDRIIGGITPRCSSMAADLYRKFVTGECIVASSARLAELAKLSENSFRDINIAFANELSIISNSFDIDVWELIQLANRHPRVNILQPGPGVGGHCIAVDPWFIVYSAPNDARLIRTAREVNDDKPKWVMDKVRAAIRNYLSEHPDIDESDVIVAFYGITFKPDIDDMRESPSLEIVLEASKSLNQTIFVVEPNINRLPANIASASLVSAEKAAQKADVHVMLVDHAAFKGVVPARGKLVDTRGVWRVVA